MVKRLAGLIKNRNEYLVFITFSNCFLVWLGVGMGFFSNIISPIRSDQNEFYLLS